MMKAQDIGKRRHPLAICGTYSGVGMRVPAGGQKVTGAALLKPAAAVQRIRRQLFFTIARDNGTAQRADLSHGFFGACTIGHQIAGTYHVIRANPKRPRLRDEGACRAVCPGG